MRRRKTKRTDHKISRGRTGEYGRRGGLERIDRQDMSLGVGTEESEKKRLEKKQRPALGEGREAWRDWAKRQGTRLRRKKSDPRTRQIKHSAIILGRRIHTESKTKVLVLRSCEWASERNTLSWWSQGSERKMNRRIDIMTIYFSLLLTYLMHTPYWLTGISLGRILNICHYPQRESNYHLREWPGSPKFVWNVSLWTWVYFFF